MTRAVSLWKSKKTGAVILDAATLDRIPYYLLTNPPNNSVTVSANQQAGPIILAVSKDGPCEVESLIAQRTGIASVGHVIQDGNPQGLPLMNNPCHIDTIFGSGQQPLALPEALFLPEGHALSAFISDLSAASNVVRLGADTSRLRKPVLDPSGALARLAVMRRQYISIPYFYTFDTGSIELTASTAGSGNMSIAADHNFEIHAIAAVSTGTFSISIVNQSTGDSLITAPSGQNYEVPNALICGSNTFPFKLHEPWMIGAGQKIVVSMTDTSAATNTVYLTLIGKAYRTGEVR